MKRRGVLRGLGGFLLTLLGGGALAQTPDFERDVVPIFTRLGCNAGGCHGAATGQNGFRLSLFGFDPQADHRRLTRELRGRRIDLVRPEGSLMLAKPTAAVPHRGGRVLDAQSRSYRVLRDWIAAGAPRETPTRRSRLVGIDFTPREFAAIGSDRRARLRVEARYENGEVDDVSHLALLSSSDDLVARLDGVEVVSGQAGEGILMARFGAFAEAARVIVVDPAAVEPPAEAEPENLVDRHLFARQRRLRVQRSAPADDSAFLRRIYLDLLNRPPRPDEARAYFADVDADRRLRLIDRLLADQAFADALALDWTELMAVAVEPNRISAKAARAFAESMRSQFRARRPFDEIIRSLLLASGGTFERPETAFFVRHSDPKVAAESVAQIFLGVRLQCAQCHNHPFERWTMDDYYGFAAYFAQVGSKAADDPRERVVFDRGAGESRHPVDNRVVAPKPLGCVEVAIAAGTDRRLAMVNWLTSDANDGMARNAANRLFARFFGRGLIEPVDDVRTSNPPSHPELLDALAGLLRSSDWNFARVAHEIVSSQSYALAAAPETLPAFASAPVRRLGAEQLLEAIDTAIGVRSVLPGLAPGSRPTELDEARAGSYFLDVFGRPRRESVCACERRNEPTLGQALHLVNGDTVSRRLASKDARIARALERGVDDRALIEELWLATYVRAPSSDEVATALAAVAAAEDRQRGFEDVLWALLNSNEFLFNH